MDAAVGHAVGHAASPKPGLASQICGRGLGLLIAGLLVLFALDNSQLSGRRSYLASARQGTLFPKAAVPSVAALAAAREPAAGSGFEELLAADPNFASICSSEFRADSAAQVEQGSSPPWLLRSDCGLGRCADSFVSSVIDSARSRPALAGLADMVPCDLFKTIQGRTTWILGDRYAVPVIVCGGATPPVPLAVHCSSPARGP